MWMGIGVIAFVAIAAWVELPALFRASRVAEALCYILLGTISSISVLLFTMEINLFYIFEWMEYPFMPLGEWLYRALVGEGGGL